MRRNCVFARYLGGSALAYVGICRFSSVSALASILSVWFSMRQHVESPFSDEQTPDGSQLGMTLTSSQAGPGLQHLIAPRLADTADTMQELGQRVVSYGSQRGRLLARLLTTKYSPQHHNSIHDSIATLDARFSRYIAPHHGLFAHNLLMLQELSDAARVAQDTAIYQKLRERFFSLGEELGEAQGRVIEQARLQRAHTKLQQLEASLFTKLNSQTPLSTSLPADIVLSDGSITQLRSALRASARQGEHEGIHNRIAAEADAAALYRNIAGWKEFLPTWVSLFKPFSVVQEILRDKPKDHLGYIDQALRERRGLGLQESLLYAYGRSYAERIRWLTSGDEIGNAAISAARELRSIFATRTGRADAVWGIYKALAPADIPAFERALARELNLLDSTLPRYILGRTTPCLTEKIKALRAGDQERAEVLHVADLLQSKRSRQLQTRWMLLALPPEQVSHFFQRYEQEHGQSLLGVIESSMRSSPARDLCLAILKGDAEKTSAARIRCSFVYRADWVGAPYLRTTPEERSAMIAAYEKHYCGGAPLFWDHLRQGAWKEDYFFLAKVPFLCRGLDRTWWPFTSSAPFIESLARYGELRPSELLRYFLIGIGTDVDGIYAVLANQTVEEIREIERDYASTYPASRFTKLCSKIPFVREFILTGDLRNDLHVELSGDHDFDISLCYEGMPDQSNDREYCATLMNRLTRRFNHERGGALLRLRGGLLSQLRGDGRVLRRFVEDYQAALAFYRAHIESASALEPDHIKRFNTLVRLAETQADAFRDAKITVSNLVLNSGAFIGASVGAAAVLFFSSLPWWSAAVASGCGSLCWRWVQGTLLLGRGFGKTDAAFQAVRAFIDGASMFTIRAGVATLSGFLGRQLSSGVAKGSFKTSLHRFIRSIENSIRRQDKARHIMEKRSLVASPTQLSLLTEGFLKEIEINPDAIGSEALTRGRRIEEVFFHALLPPDAERSARQ